MATLGVPGDILTALIALHQPTQEGMGVGEEGGRVKSG